MHENVVLMHTLIMYKISLCMNQHKDRLNVDTYAFVWITRHNDLISNPKFMHTYESSLLAKQKPTKVCRSCVAMLKYSYCVETYLPHLHRRQWESWEQWGSRGNGRVGYKVSKRASISNTRSDEFK